MDDKIFKVPIETDKADPIKKLAAGVKMIFKLM